MAHEPLWNARTAKQLFCWIAVVHVFGAGRSFAQVTPNTHWGSIMLPEEDRRVDVAASFVLFTQYGKEVLPGSNAYAFIPYNDIHETLGFNVASLTVSENRSRFPVLESSVQVRWSVIAGLVDDHVTEFLQNDIAHWGRVNGNSPLRRVPRHPGDQNTADGTSYGPTKATPILGFSQEYFFRLEDHDDAGARSIQRPSPLFVGGGYALSTINHEAFLHVGASPIGIRGGCAADWLCLNFVGVAGMLRAGVLVPSYHLNDLTGGFTNAQGGPEVTVAVGGFPITVTGMTTYARGFFVASRTHEDTVSASLRNEDVRKAYDTKRDKIEYFQSWRVRIGNFGFEYLNDSPGGKDTGPTFAVNAGIDIGRSDWLVCEEKWRAKHDDASELNPVKKAWLKVSKHLSCL
jgi:hypothetical protein